MHDERIVLINKTAARIRAAADILDPNVEILREAAQANAMAALAQLKASILLMIAEKIAPVAPVIDAEIVRRLSHEDAANWSSLQSLSDELHAAIKLAKG
jgi:hypothetical protein